MIKLTGTPASHQRLGPALELSRSPRSVCVFCINTDGRALPRGRSGRPMDSTEVKALALNFVLLFGISHCCPNECRPIGLKITHRDIKASPHPLRAGR